MELVKKYIIVWREKGENRTVCFRKAPLPPPLHTFSGWYTVYYFGFSIASIKKISLTQGCQQTGHGLETILQSFQK